QRLGRSWNIEECIDLRVSGKRHRWLISMAQAAGPGLDRTGPDLGEGVAEALFHWAQRRRIRDVDEVALPGPLLANALFPQRMADHLSLVSQADRILVRLHVEVTKQLAGAERREQIGRDQHEQQQAEPVAELRRTGTEHAAGCPPGKQFP